MVDSSGLENRHSSSNYRGFESLSLQLFIAKIGFFHLFFSLILSFTERKARLDGIAEPEPKKNNRYRKSQLRGVMKRTGSKSRSIPFSNPAAAARALPACHKCPTKKKNPRTK